MNSVRTNRRGEKTRGRKTGPSRDAASRQLVRGSVGALRVALAAEVAVARLQVRRLRRAVSALLADRRRGAGEEHEAEGVLVAVGLVAGHAAGSRVRVGDAVARVDLDLGRRA